MIRRSNPFFTPADSGRDEPPPRRLYARFERMERSTLFFEAVDADWMDETLAFRASPDPWSDVGPDAPVSILEIGLRNWMVLRKRSDDHWQQSRGRRSWFELIVDSHGIKVKQYLNLFAARPREIPVRKAMRADEVTQRGFSRMMSLSKHVRTKDDIEAVLPKDQPIEWLTVYDVGQGSANAVLDQTGMPCMYMDFGGGVTAHAATFPTDLEHMCLGREQPIVLSHWDWDHWSSAGRFPAAQTLTWIVPNQTFGIVHSVLAALIAANGTLMVWPRGLPSVHSGQISILKCQGNDRNNSGLAVSIAGPNGEPPILFPGDASYWNVPNGSSVHTSVVAPHHGAKSGVTMPGSAGSPYGRVAYSYGADNEWDHPRSITKARHAAAGWPHGAGPVAGQDRHTADRAAIPELGHIGLSWKSGTPPRPACGGGMCDQAIMQT